jgi:hypothetical protein
LALDWLPYSISSVIELLRNFADQLQLTRGYAQSIRLTECIMTVQARWIRLLLALDWLLYSSFTTSADILQTFADPVELTGVYVQSIRLVEYIKTVQLH